MTIDANRSDLAKILLVACDQAYNGSVTAGVTKLTSFPDSPIGQLDAPERSMPQAWNSLGLDQWIVLKRYDDGTTGFGATLFRKSNDDGSFDYIVAMQGTRGPNIQDWGGNLIYGWDKWTGTQPGGGQELLRDLLALEDINRIHFTGQSLGGALAEYALYDYAKALQGLNQVFDPTKVTLTTFNGLGGIEALQANRTGPDGFNSNVALFTNVDTAHFYITNDLVSRLGGGHLNGAENEHELRFMQTTPEGYVLRQNLVAVANNFFDTHRIEAGFYGGFYQASLTGPFGDRRNDFPLDFTQAVQQEISILHIQNLARAGTSIAWLFNENGALQSDTEALARATAALIIGMGSGPRDEVQALVNAIAESLYASKTWISSEFSRDAFKVYFQQFLPLLANSPSAVVAQVAAQIVALAAETGGQSSVATMPAGFAEQLQTVIAGAAGASSNLTFDPVEAANAVNNILSLAEGKAKAGVLYAIGGALGIISAALTVTTLPVVAQTALVTSVLQVAVENFDDAVDATEEMLRVVALTLQQELDNGAQIFMQVMADVSQALSDAANRASQFAVNVQAFQELWKVAVGDALADVAKSISNAYDDLTLKFVDTFEWGAAIARNTLVQLVSSYASIEATLSGQIRSAFDSAIEVFEAAAQAIQVISGHSPNPFNTAGYDPDTVPIPSEELEESGGQVFTVFLAYDAPDGGQQVRIKLEGDGIDQIRVMGSEPITVVDGEFTLTIQENAREANFVVISDEDVDTDSAITISATLVDGTGTATHETHLEVNLTLDAEVETPTVINNVILGDQDPEALDDTLNGTAGNDRIAGLSQNDRLIGNEGNDVLEGGTDVNVLKAGTGADQLFGEDAFDLATLTTHEGYGGEVSTGVRGDWLNGQRDDDTLVGAAGNDGLTGGGGSDLFLAGAGDDFILGDHDWTAADFEWVHLPVANPFDALTGVMSFGELYDVAAAADIIYAGAGNDNVGAGPGDDVVHGESGNDLLAGWQGEDVLLGGSGDDRLTGEFYGDLPEDVFGADYLDGEDGDDDVYGEGGADVLFGGEGNDRLFGHADWSLGTTPQYDEADHLEGEAGDDFLHGQGGDDFIDGGEDNDTVYGDAGSDLIYGGVGDDYLVGEDPANPSAGDGADSIDGGAGNDQIFGEGGADTLEGGDDNDLVTAGAGDDLLSGGLGADELQAGSGDDELDGGDGADLLFGDADDVGPGTSGVDSIFGGADADQLVGGGAADLLDGGDGDDQLFGDDDTTAGAEHGADILSGGTGDDTIQGYGGDDTILGGDGVDSVLGSEGGDYIDGGSGNDLLYGDGNLTPLAEQGDDVLVGGDGDDQLVGYAGADTLDAGAGTDTLFGGADDDTYVFSRGNGATLIFEESGAADAVEFAADITPDEVTAARGTQFPNDLVLTVGSSELTIANQFSTNTSFRVEELRFADGTVWTPGSTPMLVRGTTANNNLVGTSGPDVFEGVAGNDTLTGGVGNDTYRFYRGEGVDTVTDFDTTPGNTDRILYAADILPEDIQESRSGNNLVLQLVGTNDLVTVTNYFLNDGLTPNSVEQIKFLSTGTILTVDTMKLAVLTGTSGNEQITGYATADSLAGLAGNDTVLGNAGNDTLGGGTGNDVLQGGTGNDVYIIARGDGQDTITDVDSTSGNVDRIRYAADILPSEVKATRSGNHLVLTLTGTTDQLTVTNYFENDGVTPSSVEQIEFLADSTVWDLDTVKTLVLIGTSGNDTISGYPTDDALSGLGGNDSLTGNSGNDTLDGGTGNDVQQGSSGNDTYVIARGDGQDTVTDVDATGGNVDRIQYAADILPSEVKATRTGNHLILMLTGTADQVTVTNYFENEGSTPSLLERIEFLADGTVWDLGTVKGLVLTGTSASETITGYATDDMLSGLGGNDALFGRGGNDTLNGGTGNDTVAGEAGADTYLFARGDGQDLIDNAPSDAAGTTDVLSFATGISPGEISLSRTVNDLVLSIQASTDQITIRDYFLGGQSVVEEIRFADGTLWTQQTVLSFFPITGTEGNDALFGTDGNDVILGLGGNDTIFARNGNDTIVGGPGNELISSTSGSDVYMYDPGDGSDDITDSDIAAGEFDVLEFGAGISTSAVNFGTTGSNQTTQPNLRLLLGTEYVQIGNYFNSVLPTIDEIRFSDGTIWTEGYIGPLVPFVGTSGNDSMQDGRLSRSMSGLGGADTLRGGGGNDTIDGALGADHLHGEDGDDHLIAGAGEANNATISNHLFGGNGSDVLVASGKPDFLYGEEGNDILLGAAGRDWLEDTGGNNLIAGGATLDDIWMGDQNDLVIAGAGDDFVDGDRDADGLRGQDILAFNKSDGKDPVSRLGSGSTISIGGGTTYSNLSLVKQGTSLLVKTGSSHYMTLSNWYGSPTQKNVSVLQIVIEGTSNYNAGSSNPMNNRKIQAFDFLGLVAAFDAAGNPSNFNVANNLANFRLWGSDTDAIGGAIAYQYARTGSITSLTHGQMRAIISDAAFGNSAQSIVAPAGLSAMSGGEETGIQQPAAAMVAGGQPLVAEDTSSGEGSTVAPDAGAAAPENVTDREVEISGGELIQHGSPSAVTLAPGAASHPGISLGQADGQGQGAAAAQSNDASAGGDGFGGSSSAAGVGEHASAVQDIGWQRISSQESAPEADVDAIAASWFTRRSPHEDLSLLDDILRGEELVNAPPGSSVAAAWEASHRWLSHYANGRKDAGDADTAGADLSGLSLLGTGNAAYDMPRAAVGLQDVSGHSLKSFWGLREGVNVLTQP